MLGKKGLSDIVTNVLIILLVLVAVGIIWAFVRPTIDQGAGQLQGVNDCLTIDIEPTACSIPTTSGAVTIYRKSGSGTLSAVKIIGHTATQSQAIDFTPAPALTELNTVTTGTLTFNFNPDYVTVAAVIDLGNGQTKTCSESIARQNCP